MPEISGGRRDGKGYCMPEKLDLENKISKSVYYQILPNGDLMKRSFGVSTQKSHFGEIQNFEEVIIGKNARVELKNGEYVLIYDEDSRINHGYNQ